MSNEFNLEDAVKKAVDHENEKNATEKEWEVRKLVEKIIVAQQELVSMNKRIKDLKKKLQEIEAPEVSVVEL
jgi:hypothetical protein